MIAVSLLSGLYAGCLALLAIYGAHRLWMVAQLRWSPDATSPRETTRLPRVCVQLPLYNERTVATRLIEAAGALDYPAELLEIQVLDDSTDETGALVDEAILGLQSRGLHASTLRRKQRIGFKAGALDAGMQASQAEFLCVFDADFTPRPEFLRELVPYFEDPAVGMVQARWGHENRDDSALTRAQATLLDGHFVIEHKVRHDGGLFFNFNGTAGIWRRAAIEDGGGWQHDTLTEDLDLSYRAQLAGWRFVYAPHVVSPAELPPSMAAFKSQQHRWAKGSVQVFRKLGRPIFSSSEPLRVRLEAFTHLTGNIGYPLVLLLALLLPLVVLEQAQVPQLLHLSAFLLCTLSVALFYERSQRAVRRGLICRLRDTTMAISLGIGMCVSQTRAVIEGLLPGTGTFVRTPKRGTSSGIEGYGVLLRGLPGIELALAAWFGWGIFAAGQAGLWGAMPFLGLFFASFAWVGGLGLAERWWAAFPKTEGDSGRVRG